MVDQPIKEFYPKGSFQLRIQNTKLHKIPLDGLHAGFAV